MRRAWQRLLVVVLLACVAAPAFALGLGQIQVKSRAGQPLLAEIPIISNDPAELQGLQAQLASPETFRRIGLEPPQGIVSDLQFALAVDNAGRPIIRVTTATPVQQPLLTFLVEVNWGQGRLVREYSALVDTPATVAAPIQPPIQAPAAAPSNTIVRAPAAAAPVAPVSAQPTPAAPAEPAPTDVPPPAPVVAQAPVPPPTPTPAPAAPPANGGDYGPVKAGDTLSVIAAQMGAGSAYSLDQTMLALLRANPDAFIGDDINRIRQGAVLRMPAADELSRYTAGQASAMVREQVAQWREARRPQAQPASVAGAEPAPGSATRANRATPRVAEARLEIAPPAASAARRAVTQSGLSAGGEGDMLRQELQQTKETLAARDEEVVELKARVAELEKLQQQQQQLIAMKDSSLASAQQALAASNRAPATTTQAATQPPGQPQAQATLPWWWWSAPLLIVLALVAWWTARRRAKVAPRKVFDTEALAAAVPDAPVVVPPQADQTAAVETRADVEAIAPTAAAPAWNARMPGAEETVVVRAPAAAPTWHTGDARADDVGPLNPAPAGHERIELARAYLDLGDVQTARSLLHEVVAGGDASARDEANRVLRDIA